MLIDTMKISLLGSDEVRVQDEFGKNSNGCKDTNDVQTKPWSQSMLKEPKQTIMHHACHQLIPLTHPP